MPLLASRVVRRRWREKQNIVDVLLWLYSTGIEELGVLSLPRRRSSLGFQAKTALAIGRRQPMKPIEYMDSIGTMDPGILFEAHRDRRLLEGMTSAIDV